MKLCKASWSLLVSRCLCAVPSVVDRDAIGIRCAFAARVKAWSRPSTRSTCVYHHMYGRERLWRCRYTSWGFTMSLCVCTSGSRGEVTDAEECVFLERGGDHNTKKVCRETVQVHYCK